MKYKTALIINVNVDSDDIDSNFFQSHFDSFQDGENPKENEITNSLISECERWLNDLGFWVSVEHSDREYLRKGLDVALELMGNRDVNEWAKIMEEE